MEELLQRVREIPDPAMKEAITIIIAEARKAGIEEALGVVAKEKRGHNKSHTWVENGYCRGCSKHLTTEELIILFGWNESRLETIKNITALIKKHG